MPLGARTVSVDLLLLNDDYFLGGGSATTAGGMGGAIVFGLDADWRCTEAWLGEAPADDPEVEEPR